MIIYSHIYIFELIEKNKLCKKKTTKVYK